MDDRDGLPDLDDLIGRLRARGAELYDRVTDLLVEVTVDARTAPLTEWKVSVAEQMAHLYTDVGIVETCLRVIRAAENRAEGEPWPEDLHRVLAALAGASEN